MGGSGFARTAPPPHPSPAGGGGGGTTYSAGAVSVLNGLAVAPVTGPIFALVCT